MGNQKAIVSGRIDLRGYIYEGELRCNKPHGFGKEFDRTGGLNYEGFWQYGLKNGQGKEYRSRVYDLVYEGEFKNNHYEGKGIFYFNNGYVYHGHFEDREFQGPGVVYAPDGDLNFVGTFSKNKKDGIGFQYYKGKVIKGEWEEGELIRQIDPDHGSRDYFESIDREKKIHYDEILFELGVEMPSLAPSRTSIPLTDQTVLKLDPSLEKAIRKDPRIQNPNPITIGDMKQLYYLDCSYGEWIKDLTGIEHAVNLSDLDLSGALDDSIIELPDLSCLVNLNSLNLNSTNISSVDSLANLPNLADLYLQDTCVTDLKPLARIKSLESLLVDRDWVGLDDFQFLVERNPSLTIYGYNDDDDDDDLYEDEDQDED